MSQGLSWVWMGLAGIGLVGLSACADASGPANGDAPRLDELVVTDPNFDFSTTETVQLDLVAAEGTEPQAVEVSDAEGRRLMDGAFRGSASLNLKLPVGRAGSLKVRVGQGQQAVERELVVGEGGKAATEL